MRDAVYQIIRESRQHAYRGRTSFLPSSALGGRGERVDIMILGAAVGHTLVDVVVVDLTRRDLVERAARQDLVAATDAERRKFPSFPLSGSRSWDEICALCSRDV